MRARFISLAITSVLPAQAAQLVGPVLDIASAVHAAPGFSTASDFSGGCRDNQGNYWTTCLAANNRYLVRVAPGGLLTGFITLAIGATTDDLAFDALRDRIWVLAANQPPRVYNAVSGTLVGAAAGFIPTNGIAWNGADRILAAGQSSCWDAASLQVVSGSPVPSCQRGLIYHAATGRVWGGFWGSAAPGNVTASFFAELPSPSSTMPPDLAIDNGGGPRGGYPAGCEAWQNPTTSESLGVFCQVLGGGLGPAVLYTCRLGGPIGAQCGGPIFAEGPVVVQSHLYSTAHQANGFAWLVVSFGPGLVSHPIFAPGCSIHVDPASAVILGPFLPDFGGTVTGWTSIPINPAFQELPLFFQWATLGFGGQFTLSEARSAAVKQS